MSKYSSVFINHEQAKKFLEGCILSIQARIDALGFDLDMEIDEYEKPRKFLFWTYSYKWTKRDCYLNTTECRLMWANSRLDKAKQLLEMSYLGGPLVITTEDYEEITKYLVR